MGLHTGGGDPPKPRENKDVAIDEKYFIRTRTRRCVICDTSGSPHNQLMNGPEGDTYCETCYRNKMFALMLKDAIKGALDERDEEKKRREMGPMETMAREKCPKCWVMKGLCAGEISARDQEMICGYHLGWGAIPEEHKERITALIKSHGGMSHVP